MSSRPRQRVLVIPDLHAPFSHPRALEFLRKLQRQFQPTQVVCIGDLVDQHALSAFVKGPRSLNASSELHAAKTFLQRLAKLFPKMLCCLGNHDLRYLKRANEAGIPGEYLKDFSDIIGAPQGWKFADQFEIDGVLYLHGDNYSGQGAALNMVKSKMQSVCFGHTHQGSLVYHNGAFGLNVGALTDESAYAFEYAKFAKSRAFIGAGLVLDGVPQLVPLG